MKTLKRGPELYALIKTLLSRLFFVLLFFPRRFCLSALPFLRPSISETAVEGFYFLVDRTKSFTLTYI